MKSKKKELDGDVIGGQGSLTPAEEKHLANSLSNANCLHRKIRKHIDQKPLEINSSPKHNV